MKHLILLLLVSCAIQQQKIEKTTYGEIKSISAEVETKEVTTAPTAEDLELLEVKSFSGFTKAEISRFWQYSKIVDEITHSQCFENYINGFPNLINNKDQTKKELLANLRSEKPQLNFVMYYKNNSTVGYTYPNSDTIWMNRKFHSNYTLHQSAANLAHERSHKLGYTHDFKRTARRSRQAPYPIGDGIRKCSQNINYNLDTKQRVRVCYRSWRQLWLRKNCYWRLK